MNGLMCVTAAHTYVCDLKCTRRDEGMERGSEWVRWSVSSQVIPVGCLIVNLPHDASRALRVVTNTSTMYAVTNVGAGAEGIVRGRVGQATWPHRLDVQGGVVIEPLQLVEPASEAREKRSDDAVGGGARCASRRVDVARSGARAVHRHCDNEENAQHYITPRCHAGHGGVAAISRSGD
jgi:hypothetical protein